MESRLQRLAEIKIADTWTTEDETSAVQKLAKAAFTYNNQKGLLNVMFYVV